MENELQRARGQAAIESMLTLPVFLIGIIAISVILLLGFSRLWIQHQSYEALMCLASHYSEKTCLSQLKTKVEVFGNVIILKSVRVRRFANGIELNVTASIAKISWKHKVVFDEQAIGNTR